MSTAAPGPPYYATLRTACGCERVIRVEDFSRRDIVLACFYRPDPFRALTAPDPIAGRTFILSRISGPYSALYEEGLVR